MTIAATTAPGTRVRHVSSDRVGTLVQIDPAQGDWSDQAVVDMPVTDPDWQGPLSANVWQGDLTAWELVREPARRFLTDADRNELYELVREVSRTAQGLGFGHDVAPAMTEFDGAFQAVVKWVKAHSLDGLP